MAVPRGYYERGGLDQATLRAEVEALRAETRRLHGLVAEARSWIDPEEHEAWEKQADTESNSCSLTIDLLRAEVMRLREQIAHLEQANGTQEVRDE